MVGFYEFFLGLSMSSFLVLMLLLSKGWGIIRTRLLRSEWWTIICLSVFLSATEIMNNLAQVQAVFASFVLYVGYYEVKIKWINHVFDFDRFVHSYT
jgi:hypothetical protein